MIRPGSPPATGTGTGRGGDSAAARAISARRAVVADDGASITLTLYGDQSRIALDVPPHYAITLASDLLLAARRRLGG